MMAVLTVVIIAWDPKSSLRVVESQHVAIARIASTPARGWTMLIMVHLPSAMRHRCPVPQPSGISVGLQRLRRGRPTVWTETPDQ